MAFVDFKDGAALAPPALITRTAATFDTRFNALERRVIELAREDGLATLEPRGKRSWLARLILGPVPPSPVLANERLEALRRLAVRAWHEGYLVPVSALHEAKAAGFSEAEVGAVLDMVARLREPVRRLAA